MNKLQDIADWLKIKVSNSDRLNDYQGQYYNVQASSIPEVNSLLQSIGANPKYVYNTIVSITEDSIDILNPPAALDELLTPILTSRERAAKSTMVTNALRTCEYKTLYIGEDCTVDNCEEAYQRMIQMLKVLGEYMKPESPVMQARKEYNQMTKKISELTKQRNDIVAKQAKKYATRFKIDMD